MWIEIEIERADSGARVSARGSRGERTASRALGLGEAEQGDADALLRFAKAVREAAARAIPLPAPLLAEAQALGRAVLGTDVEPLLARLVEASQGPLLVRLGVADAELQAVPWEAICSPGQAMGFWASAPDLLPVRTITTTHPWQPRKVRGAVRILGIAPSGGPGISALRRALEPRIDAGEVEWLDPVEGSAARLPWLFERLRREPVPHVLHFVGHGGQQSGSPVLRLADVDGEEVWLPVELLAQQLEAGFRGFLRLIVLECCEGARPSAFASAAEILARAGADAVVAHLWPVHTDVARAFSEQLYRVLAGADRGSGDVAVAVNEARRSLLGAFQGSAEAFSPVVYLRGPDGVLFDFSGRKIEVRAPSASAPSSSSPSRADPALARLFKRPFSLLLGDRFKEQRQAIAGFRDKLQKDLLKTAGPISPDLPMSALAQRFALHRGVGKLGKEFQRAFSPALSAPPLIEDLARAVCPGVHTTLLRHPWLEQAIAEQQPQRTLYVVQPSEEGMTTLRREAGGAWEELDEPPAAFDPDEEIVLLRLYGGYTPELVLSRPLLTEDDYALGLRELGDALPRDLANAVLSTLSYRPALILGLSTYTGHHRVLLHRIYPRGIPRGSLVVVDPSDSERELWKQGAGLPGKDEGVDVIDWPGDLASALGGQGA